MRRDHGATDGENRNRVMGLTWRDGALYFVRVGMSQLDLQRLDPQTGELEQVAAYAYQGAYRFVMYCAITPELQVCFSDKYGSVWLAAEGRQPRLPV